MDIASLLLSRCLSAGIFSQPRHKLVEPEAPGLVQSHYEGVCFICTGGYPDSVNCEEGVRGCERRTLVSVYKRVVLSQAFPHGRSFLDDAIVVARLRAKEGCFQ